MQWQPIETSPERQTVMTKIDDGSGIRNEQELKRIGRLWFFPDGSMYVYYTPTHWALPDLPDAPGVQLASSADALASGEVDGDQAAPSQGGRTSEVSI